MKKIILVMCFVFICGVAYAQCVAEVKDVLIDEDRGSIIVETEYKLNGEVVQIGKTRYLEISGTNEEIIAKAKDDIAIHSENIIRRINNNRIFLHNEKLKHQKTLTTPIKDAIKLDLIGYKTTKTEAIDIFKGKDIKVTYGEKNSISDSVVIAE